MIPQNNPFMALAQMMKNGGDPMPIIQQAARMNPRMGQFLQMVNGKSPEQLKQMAMNIAKEKGTTVEAMAQQMGFSIPK